MRSQGRWKDICARKYVLEVKEEERSVAKIKEVSEMIYTEQTKTVDGLVKGAKAARVEMVKIPQILQKSRAGLVDRPTQLIYI